MPSTIREFIDRLAETQIVPRAELDAIVQRESAAQPDADSTVLAAELVRHGMLSEFQAGRLSRREPILIDDYVLLEERGAGGMARVYKARHRVMGRIVAVKLIRDRESAGRQAVGRFQREIQAVAALDHPNIVRAYDAGECDGTHYLAMEYVEGEDLAHLIRRSGALPPDRAIDYIAQAAAGLAYAHRQGIIHRDIKPSNLMLTPEGSVRVLDLGLARLQHPAEVGPDDVTDAITETGDMLGTAAYMAPEQSQDAHLVDHRSDIYSLGCTLYFLLTGKTVYGGSSYIEKVLAHRQAALPPLQIESGDLPAELQVVFHRMIAKRPEDRFQSMDEVISALRGASADRTPPERLVSAGAHPSRSRTQVWLGVAGLAALAAILVAYAKWGGGDDSDGSSAQRIGPVDTSGTITSGSSNTEEIAAAESAEQRIARRIFDLGGSIDVATGNEFSGGVDRIETLPAEQFQILRINLNDTAVNDFDLAAIGQLATLELLNLAGSRITSAGVQQLTELPALKTLYLQSSPVDDAAITTIATLPALEELDLRGTNVGDAGVAKLAECRTLRVLRLDSSQPLTPELVPHLARMTGLTGLELRGMRFIDDAVVAQLTSLEALTYLDLGGTQVSDASVPHLSQFVHLSHLLLDESRVTREGIDALRQSLPGCEVTGD